MLVGALVPALVLALTGCGGDRAVRAAASWSGAPLINVPGDFATIQQAVDVARPGDVVLVHPGLYRESVTISTPRVTLRGSDRSGVVLDGGFRLANGVTSTGDGSVVENLTVRDYLANGVLFTGVTDKQLQQHGAGGSAYNPLDTVRFPPVRGFRASYVTAYDNGLYGVYAFDARAGVIEDSYASGQADSGVYVGQCRPCDTLVRGNTLRHNAVGVEITNASENLSVLGNRIDANRVGLTLNSNDLEALAPQHGALIAGNVIAANDAPDTPEQADGGFGIGVGIGGGTGDVLTRNLITGNASAGVLVTDVQGHPAGGNRILANRARGNGVDVVLAAASGGCFAGNTPALESPAGLEAARPCGAAADGERSAGQRLAPGTAAAVQAPPGVSFEDVAAPPAQPSMPGPVGAPGRPAVGLPGAVDADAYGLPARVDAVPVPDRRTSGALPGSTPGATPGATLGAA